MPPDKHCLTCIGLALALAGGLALPGRAWAGAPPDDPSVPAGTAGQDDASSGSTELGGGDEFSTTKEVAAEDEAAAEDEPKDPHADDATEFDIALGGMFTTGNARTLAFTGLSNFRLRRTIHQFAASVAGNYGASGVPDSRRYEPSTGNVQGLVRYDVFFAKRWTAFVQVTARHDPFQELVLRLNVDPGFAFYALNQPKHRLWFEAGYDFQFDVRTDRALDPVDPETGDPLLDDNGEEIHLDKTLINHAVRLYVGYSNKLSERVSFDTGLEYLQSVIVAERLRLNYLAALNTQLVENLSLAVTFTLRYDNTPVPTVVKLDTVTAFQLAYRFF